MEQFLWGVVFYGLIAALVIWRVWIMFARPDLHMKLEADRRARQRRAGALGAKAIKWGAKRWL